MPIMHRWYPEVERLFHGQPTPIYALYAGEWRVRRTTQPESRRPSRSRLWRPIPSRLNSRLEPSYLSILLGEGGTPGPGHNPTAAQYCTALPEKPHRMVI